MVPFATDYTDFHGLNRVIRGINSRTYSQEGNSWKRWVQFGNGTEE